MGLSLREKFINQEKDLTEAGRQGEMFTAEVKALKTRHLYLTKHKILQRHIRGISESVLARSVKETWGNSA